MKTTPETLLLGIDPEHLTTRQMRMILRDMARTLSYTRPGQKSKDTEKGDEDEVLNDNDDLVALDEESHGKPKTPKVYKDDLPKGSEDLLAEDEDEEEEEPAQKKGKTA